MEGDHVGRPRQRASAGNFTVLCFNIGSSSVKFAYYSLGKAEEVLLADGIADRVGLRDGHFEVRGKKKETLEKVKKDFSEPGQAVREILAFIDGSGLPPLSAVGHRIVHGGPDHTAPAFVDALLIRTLKGLIPFASLHLPGEIRGIETIAEHFPKLPQVACFDTAFHRRMPEIAQRLPLRRSLWEEGVRRYGFHGLSYEYILDALGPEGRGRVIVAHLGNGASMAALYNGRPLDTTMGFTPTGGFMMGTRSGDLDPGVLLHLIKDKGVDGDGIDRLVNHEAGLLGVSGTSSDMKTLLDRSSADPHAAQAVEMYCYHLRKTIGALAAVLGGIDTLVFTGGIGERAAPVRKEVCAALGHLGIRLDLEKNLIDAEIISTRASACTVRVMATNEDLMIARHTERLIAGGGCF